MGRGTLLGLGAAVLACSALLWGAEAVFRGTAASAIVLVAITVIALAVVRPGWHVRPRRFDRAVFLPFGLLLLSAAAAGAFLQFVPMEHPYDTSAIDLAGALPTIAGITAVEELLFRHAMYRWVESRTSAARIAVVGTALAFGWAHLGPLFVGASAHTVFHVLQSAYMVWVGLLLGEIRRLTSSWPMCWLGHLGYNFTVLLILDAPT